MYIISFCKMDKKDPLFEWSISPLCTIVNIKYHFKTAFLLASCREGKKVHFLRVQYLHVKGDFCASRKKFHLCFVAQFYRKMNIITPL